MEGIHCGICCCLYRNDGSFSYRRVAEPTFWILPLGVHCSWTYGAKTEPVTRHDSCMNIRSE